MGHFVPFSLKKLTKRGTKMFELCLYHHGEACNESKYFFSKEKAEQCAREHLKDYLHSLAEFYTNSMTCCYGSQEAYIEAMIAQGHCEVFDLTEIKVVDSSTSITSASDAQLREWHTLIIDELGNRENARLQELWDKVRDAVIAYTQEAGIINVTRFDRDIHIDDSRVSFDTIGIIEVLD